MKIVTAALISKDGLYLLCQRGEADKLAGKWEFPGGKVEEGETAEECLIREIREELCLQIDIADHYCDSLYRYADGAILLKAYRVTVTGGTMRLTVHSGAEWVEAAKLRDYDLLPADVEIAARLAAASRPS